MTLFGEDKKIIRTLGFYQPFCTLMMPPYYKDETRWVRKGKKPPFPLGKYAFYSTKNRCTMVQLMDWSGLVLIKTIADLVEEDATSGLDGYLIGMGDLVSLRPMTYEDEKTAFVLWKGDQIKKDKDGNEHIYIQWVLKFENVIRATPQKFDHGKQGVGFLPEQYINQL